VKYGGSALTTHDLSIVYLGACWAIANEHDVSLRTLDMALWALGGDE
jgi:hypothetical protein